MTRHDMILETVSELLEVTRAAYRTAFRKNQAYAAANALMDVFDRPRWIIHGDDPMAAIQGNAILDPEAKPPTWDQANNQIQWQGKTRPGIIPTIQMSLRGSPERLRIANVLRDLQRKGIGQTELDKLSNVIFKAGEGYKPIY